MADRITNNPKQAALYVEDYAPVGNAEDCTALDPADIDLSATVNEFPALLCEFKTDIATYLHTYVHGTNPLSNAPYPQTLADLIAFDQAHPDLEGPWNDAVFEAAEATNERGVTMTSSRAVVPAAHQHARGGVDSLCGAGDRNRSPARRSAAAPSPSTSTANRPPSPSTAGMPSAAAAVVSDDMVAPRKTPCSQSKAWCTSGTTVERRPPNSMASIGTPAGSSHSGAIEGHCAAGVVKRAFG